MNINWNKRNTAIAVSVAVYAVLILLLMIISNNRAISTWINGVLSVLAPLILGFAIAYLCNPIEKLFENKVYLLVKNNKLRRVLSIVCTYLVVALVITLVLLIIIPQVSSSLKDFTNNIDTYTQQAITYINKLIYKFDISANDEIFGDYISIEDVQAKISKWFTESSELFQSLWSYVMNYGSSILTGVKNLLLGLFVSIYILSSKERLIAQLKRMCTAFFKKEKYDSLLQWVDYTNTTFGQYIKAQLLDAVLVTVECAIIFSISGLRYSILLAIIIGITNIIPVFGPFIGGIPAGFIVLISSPNKLILFIILLIAIQQIDGNFVLPKLVGSTTGMTSFGVLCAITVMGGYFGVVGMVLGVPCFAIASEIIHRIVNKCLEKKDMSSELTDYYPEDALIVMSEEEGARHENKTLKKFVHWVGVIFKKLFNKIISLFKKKKD